MPANIQIPIHQAKAQLSNLVARALKGETVIICRGDTPVVQLQPITTKKRSRKFGAYKDEFKVEEKFFDELSSEELDAWEK